MKGQKISYKDETVYFNVDLTEPDEVYELTGYQESKIKVITGKYSLDLRPIICVQNIFSESMCFCWIFSDSGNALAFPSLVPKLQSQNDVSKVFTKQC